MKIYVAGSSKDVHTIRHWMSVLRSDGYEITHDWTKDFDKENELNEEELTPKTIQCIQAVKQADVILAIVSEHQSIGMYIEVGAALSDGKNIIVVDEFNNKFHEFFERHPNISITNRVQFVNKLLEDWKLGFDRSDDSENGGLSKKQTEKFIEYVHETSVLSKTISTIPFQTELLIPYFWKALRLNKSLYEVITSIPYSGILIDESDCGYFLTDEAVLRELSLPDNPQSYDWIHENIPGKIIADQWICSNASLKEVLNRDERKLFSIKWDNISELELLAESIDYFDFDSFVQVESLLNEAERLKEKYGTMPKMPENDG